MSVKYAPMITKEDLSMPIVMTRMNNLNITYIKSYANQVTQHYTSPLSL